MRPLVVSLVALLLSAAAADAQSLRGSRASLDRQNRVARGHDYTYLGTSVEVDKFVKLGLLVPIRGNGDYELASVSFPYAREELKVFVERLAQQYRAACGEKLVVTSLTRPQSRQPANASSRSVHPTGMAVDLRLSRTPACRGWLEKVLLQLESKGLIEATRERRPPHYHVALFPEPYRRYVATLMRAEVSTRLASAAATPSSALGREAAPAALASAEAAPTWRVGRGDTLWGIAREVGVSVDELKEVNGLSNARIYAGQVLALPQR